MSKPLAFVMIDDMARHVQATMRRAPNPMGESLIRMTGGLISFCLRHHIAGNFAHPGVEKMAKMGKCGHRQAQYNMNVLKNWMVMIPVGAQTGGRAATRYAFNPEGLKRALVAAGCNPSPELCEKIQHCEMLVRGAMRGAMRGAVIAPDNNNNTSASKIARANGLTILDGGRDA